MCIVLNIWSYSLFLSDTAYSKSTAGYSSPAWIWAANSSTDSTWWRSATGLCNGSSWHTGSYAIYSSALY